MPKKRTFKRELRGQIPPRSDPSTHQQQDCQAPYRPQFVSNPAASSSEHSMPISTAHLLSFKSKSRGSFLLLSFLPLLSKHLLSTYYVPNIVLVQQQCTRQSLSSFRNSSFSQTLPHPIFLIVTRALEQHSPPARVS